MSASVSDRRPAPTAARVHRGAADTPESNRTGLAGLIAEAQALKDSARDTLGRAGRLLGALKRHRKQSRLMATTLASLKQLQSIEA